MKEIPTIVMFSLIPLAKENAVLLAVPGAVSRLAGGTTS